MVPPNMLITKNLSCETKIRKTSSMPLLSSSVLVRPSPSYKDGEDIVVLSERKAKANQANNTSSE